MIGGILFTPWTRAPVMAEAEGGGQCRVGKYRVTVESIRMVAVPAIAARADFVVIDEIGRTETACEGFIPAVRTALSGRSTVIATIAARGTPAIEQIKDRPDVLLFKVGRQNRDSIPEVILKNIDVVPAGEKRRALRTAGRKDQTGRKKSTV